MSTRDEEQQKKPVGLKWRSSTLFLLVTIFIGMCTDLFLFGLVVPILPFLLQDRAGVPASEVQGHVSAQLAVYAIASVIFCPIAGVLADRTESRQVPYLGGLAALICSTVIFFLGQSVWVLMLARILQGASSAFVWTVGLAMCIDTVGAENLGKTIGTIFSLLSIGELMAPPLGGSLYAHGGVLAVAILALSILVVDFFMRVFIIEKKIARKYVSDPNSNEARATIDETRSSDDEHDITNIADEQTPLVQNDGAATEDDDLYFIPSDQPKWIQAYPLFYCLLESPSLVMSLVSAFTFASLMAAFSTTLPLRATELFDFDSLFDGLLFMPISIVNLIVGPLGGWCVDRYGTKPVSVLGFSLLAPMLFLLRLPQAEPRTEQITLFVILLALCGVGVGIIGAPAVVEAGLVIDRYYKRNPNFFGENGPYAQLYSLNSVFFNSGCAVGPVLSGTVKEAIGYGNMNAVLAGVSFAGAVGSFVWLGGKPGVLRRKISS